jgi:hypothetical protein
LGAKFTSQLVKRKTGREKVGGKGEKDVNEIFTRLFGAKDS